MAARQTLFTTALLALALSCKDADSSLLDQFEAAYDAQISHICECAVQDGDFATVSSCREIAGPFVEPDVDRSCADRVMADSAYASWIDCTLRAEQSLADCLAGEPCPARFTCADGTQDIPGSFRCDGDPDCADGSDEAECASLPPTCMSRYDDAVAECGPAPEGYTDALDQCLQQRTCSDGEAIPASWWCDGEPDCTDGSDEASC